MTKQHQANPNKQSNTYLIDQAQLSENDNAEKEKVFRADYDSPWKEILEDFEDFILFYLPDLHPEIDWTKAPEFLDKELQQIVGDAETGRRYADKLVKVWLNDGSEMHVLMHVEVQGAREAQFEERMYIYHYRIYDKYKTHVVSIAILTDDDASWKPKEYKKERWGCKIHFEFLTKKLLDYKPKWAELEQNPNPFAVVTMANLKTMETLHDHEERLRWKVWMVRELYKRGIKDAKIIRLVRFVDWMMALPDPLQEAFQIEWSTIEEENKMMYMMDFERKSYDRGKLEGIEEGHLKNQRETVLNILNRRFELTKDFRNLVQNLLENIFDKEELESLVYYAVEIEDPEQISQYLPAMAV
ncbi:MAG: hypothetical protein AAF639_01570 [Chloroflexota bacterium]